MIKHSDLKEFARKYENVGTIAKRTGSTVIHLINRLRERNVPLLSIPFGRPGNHVIFVPREISKSIQRPLPRLSENIGQNDLDQ
jgi:hypothetical protein